MITEVIYATLRHEERRPYAYYIPPRDVFAQWSSKPCRVEVEGIEVVAPESYHRVQVVLIAGDIPQISANAYPTNRACKTYFNLQMHVPVRLCWAICVNFLDLREDVAYPAYIELRIAIHFAEDQNVETE